MSEAGSTGRRLLPSDAVKPPFKTCPVRQERTVMLAAGSPAPATIVAGPRGDPRSRRRRTFRGRAFGAIGETFGEAVFATAMSGYQETLTDPSYHRQVVVATAPHIGNTGWNDEDDESGRIWVAGYVIRDAARVPSSWRSRRSLADELAAQGIVGMSRRGHPRPDPAPARAGGHAGRASPAWRPIPPRCWPGCWSSRRCRRAPGRRGQHHRGVRGRRPAASSGSRWSPSTWASSR